MSMTVVGLYPTENEARNAARELEKHGLGNLPTHIETEDTGQSSFTSGHGGGLRQSLIEAGVPQEDAEIYVEGLQHGGSLLIVETPDEEAETAARIMNPGEHVNPDEHAAREGQPSRGRDSGQRKRETTSEEEARMTEAREEINIGKRKVQGGVRIHKRVKERPVEEQVHLHDEEVDVERREASEAGRSTSEDTFKEETIEMRETREEPVVEKKTKAEGEVVARKRSQDRTETVRDTVRETVIDIEDIGEGFEKRSDDFRSHYESTYGDTDQSYDDYEEAYRIGHAYGTHDEYAGRDYSEVEPEMRRHYEERQGKGTFDRVKDAVRHAFGQSRR